MEKPYNKCADCPYLGVKCDGPNFLAMSPERWLEWSILRKDYLDVTNSWIAANGELAQGTVDRVLSGHSKDLRISTMQNITKALVGGTWGQYPCPLAAEGWDDLDDALQALAAKSEENERLHIELDELRANQRKDIEAVKAEDQRKVDYLKDIVNDLKHSNRIYRIVVAVMGLIMAAAVLIDACLRNFGWIRW